MPAPSSNSGRTGGGGKGKSSKGGSYYKLVDSVSLSSEFFSRCAIGVGWSHRIAFHRAFLSTTFILYAKRIASKAIMFGTEVGRMFTQCEALLSFRVVEMKGTFVVTSPFLLQSYLLHRSYSLAQPGPAVYLKTF